MLRSILGININKTLLGRWEHRLSEKQKNIKFVLNNLDHCGDKICGDMVFYKERKKKEVDEIGCRKVTPDLFQE